MANQQGDFIWYELMADDADAAQEFYGAVIGWTFEASGQDGMDYRQFSTPKGMVGGVMPLTPEMKNGSARPCWMGYIKVNDVDAMAKAIASTSGNIHMQPKNIPGFGRFAFVSDPQGVIFYIMKPAAHANNPNAISQSFAATEPMDGHCAWNELATTEPDAAVDFYTDQFGWKQEGDMDMGPMGKYQFFHHGTGMIGAVMKKSDEMPVSAWTYYFRVPDIDAAVKMIKTKGGQLLLEPTEIPGGEFQINAMDPQSAAFALIGKRK